ncbi:isopenicillin N synthase family dioxygenase [Pseudofrankia inefficax]|uniref:2OG-Fe(II) oxygenase n=1 Tax=Pseudofrankia inefficax (strain DSM 45817 / CECT 9037 / DDB 130130 / EuI1c) TaxID=298654 RepID=E3J0J7_PSEI1|nr:2-oxoglutarate and iron-dependent oxygenase domain-containing protein [Pseudofrankia inefficax]ADP81626.1 2OG-Fe(II) oxygenase [Pseudofrankia inefficax]
MPERRSSIHDTPVDLSGWWSGDPAARRAIATAVDRSCRETGFLLLEGHGLPDQVMDGWVAGCDAFFALPPAEKLAMVLPKEPDGNNIGYTAFGEEASAYTADNPTPPDLFEAMSFSRSDAAGPRFDRYRAWYPTNVWPARPSGWEAAYRDYEAAMGRVAEAVLGAMSLALGQGEHWLVDLLADAPVSTRANFYARPAGAPDPLPGQLRRGAHTDFGVLTLLWTDGVPGLQIRQGDEWRSVTPEPGQLVANIGDLLAMWTNDRWTSTLHRVLPPPSQTTGPVVRRSVAYFVDAYPATLVEPVPTCVTAENPARFTPIRAGDWLDARARRQLASSAAGAA